MTRKVVALFRALTGTLLLAFALNASLASQALSNEDRNWIALHLWDSFYPMTEEKSFPENLNAIEIMFNYFHKRKLGIDIERAFLKNNFHGIRSREGHFVLWVHISDRFQRTYGVDRAAIGDKTFVFKNRNSDILTGWSGSANLGALLREGIVGFARPMIVNGKPVGGFNSVDEIYNMGEADFEGGWFLDDEQLAKVLHTFINYEGKQKGYGWLAVKSERPNDPYDPPQAQLVNGYNCSDFAFTVLDAAGVVPREESETLKIKLWYPEKYLNQPLPLSALGQKGRDWLLAHPLSPSVPDNVMAEMAWQDLLFNSNGVEFFYKQQIFSETWRGNLKYVAGRVWDQEHVISWLRRRAEFVSKGIKTEIQVAAKSGTPIAEPYRRVPEDRNNRWILSDEYRSYKSQGREMERRKLRRNGIDGAMLEHFRVHMDRYKEHW